MRLRIVIPGGSGQVGTILARHFHAQDHAVTVLARHPVARSWRTATWDAESIGAWASELEGADVLINLAGRGVNCIMRILREAWEFGSGFPRRGGCWRSERLASAPRPHSS